MVEADPQGSTAAAPRSDMTSSSAVFPMFSTAAENLRPATHLQSSITKPKIYTNGTVRWGMLADTADVEPTTVEKALSDPKWVEAMNVEHDALL